MTDEADATLEAFVYDKTGNRESKERAGLQESYAYPLTSHRLTGVGARVLAYDAAGSLTNRGDGYTFEYNNAHRLSTVRLNGTVKMQALYNAKGERVVKSPPSGPGGIKPTYFVYDEGGRLLAEYLTGQLGSINLQREYIWLEDRPVAVVVKAGSYTGQILAIHTDHLGTPRAITSETGATVWTWALGGSAFGEHAPAQDPDQDLLMFTFNLRYPGQYFDSESGLYYNYFRDYEPSVGRYVESDPAGISDGPSTYGYVHQSPLVGYDPLGLTNYRGFNPQQEAEMRRAVEEAKRKVEECKTCDANGNCECFPEKDRKDRLIKKLNSATFIYKPDLGLCGYVGPMNMLRGQVQVGAPAFGTGCCSLASTLAHESNHLLAGGESSSYELEEKCFGCPGMPK